MAKKKETAEVAANDFSFFNTVKTLDPYADSGFVLKDAGFIDSGSHTLNILVSGDVYGGFPLNRVTMTTGYQGTGKSLLGKINFCRPLFAAGYFVYYLDTEAEITSLEDLIYHYDFPENQFKLVRRHTVEECHTTISNILKQLEDDKGKSLENKRKVAIVLDSQGNLSTNKALDDAETGADKADMTKAKKLAAMYRDITFRLGMLGIPMYVTNHLYKDPNAAQKHKSEDEIAGGEGPKYNASIILGLKKSIDYEGSGQDKVYKGTVVHATIMKNRLCHEKMEAYMYVDWEHGLNKYWGLHKMVEKYRPDLIRDYNEVKKEYDFLERPIDPVTGQKTRKGCLVLCDPTKDPHDWIVCETGKLHRKENIGTMLDIINEEIAHKYYRMQKPVAFGKEGEDIDLEISDAAIEEAEAADKKASKKKVISQAESLGIISSAEAAEAMKSED